MRVKAIVAKVDQQNGVMVVFTADKQFRRLPLPDAAPPPGATIEVDLPAEKRAVSSLLHTKWLAAAAVLLLVLAVGMLGTLGVAPVSAYVTLDMKPSLQLAVDEQGKITEITALNEAGKALLEQLDLKNMDIYLAVKEIVQNAGKAGYFDSQKENIVMAGITKAKDSSSYQIDEAKLRAIIHDELSAKQYPGYVVVNVVDRDQWQNAKQSGYSVNQVIMSVRAKEHGVSIDPQVIKDQGLTQVMEGHQSDIPRWFGKNSCEVTWQGHNSVGQPTYTNNTQPAGEHDGNEGREDKAWQSTTPNNSRPAGEHNANEEREWQSKTLNSYSRPIGEHNANKEQPAQVNTNTTKDVTKFSDDDWGISSEQPETTTTEMDGHNAAPAASYTDQNNNEQDNERSDSHSQ